MKNKIINIAELCRVLHKEYPYNTVWEWRRKVDLYEIGTDVFKLNEKEVFFSVLDREVSKRVAQLKGEEVKSGN